MDESSLLEAVVEKFPPADSAEETGPASGGMCVGE